MKPCGFARFGIFDAQPKVRQALPDNEVGIGPNKRGLAMNSAGSHFSPLAHQLRPVLLFELKCSFETSSILTMFFLVH